jgi:hypothetical protein
MKTSAGLWFLAALTLRLVGAQARGHAFTT